MKKRYIVLGLIVAFFLGWRIYQNSEPKDRMMKIIQQLEHREDTIRLVDGSTGEDVTEQFYEDNALNYKLKNWRSIYYYFRENVSVIDCSNDPTWAKDTGATLQP